MTKTERDLLTECELLARETGHELRDLITDAETYWRGSGRIVEPRRWRRRADACRRLLERLRCVEEYATAGLDAVVEIDGFDRLAAEQYSDEVAYLADFQG
jgi:hypothetical protein